MTAHTPRCAAFEECPDCFFAGSDKAKAEQKALVEAVQMALDYDRDFSKWANGKHHCNACSGDYESVCVETPNDRRGRLDGLYQTGSICAAKQRRRLMDEARRLLLPFTNGGGGKA